jgi:diphthamide biosynthesis protein 2
MCLFGGWICLLPGCLAVLTGMPLAPQTLIHPNHSLMNAPLRPDAGKLAKVKAYLRAHGKEAYLLSMGIPTPQKLGNFLQVDLFVLLSCPQTSLLSSKEYIRPIVTLGELELAMEERAISDYTFDHPAISATVPGSFLGGVDGSLATLTLEDGGVCTALASRSEAWEVSNGPSLLAKSNVYYTGLDPTLAVPVSLATEGRSGLARTYSHETS